VKKSGKILFLNLDDVLWIEAVGDYASFHTKEYSFLVHKTMKELESRLDPNLFVRIHRSSIIHLEAIENIAQWTKGRWKVNLKNGQSIFISRSGAQKLKRFFL
jgi:two-component system LytT family response regulator